MPHLDHLLDINSDAPEPLLLSYQRMHWRNLLDVNKVMPEHLVSRRWISLAPTTGPRCYLQFSLSESVVRFVPFLPGVIFPNSLPLASWLFELLPSPLLLFCNSLPLLSLLYILLSSPPVVSCNLFPLVSLPYASLPSPPTVLFLSLLYALLHSSTSAAVTLTLRRIMSYIYGAPILDVSRSHTTTQHSRYYSSGRVISSSQRPLPDNTRYSQQTNIHAPGGIRNHDLSRRTASELRVRPRGHWDWH